MGKLGWYWHRLRAMSPGEMALHARKKLRQRADARRRTWPAVSLEHPGAFPKLPKPEDAPEVLRAALKRDVENTLAGRWKAFGHLELQVEDPPKWHKDYLVGKELATNASAFGLNHRALPDGADIKLIWELSRWHQLVRLAMAAYVLGDERAATKCVEWLEDWVLHNPPYHGWNWTSALEVGMRLIQFTWIDALLSGSSRREEAHSELPKSSASLLTSAPTLERRLAALRHQILPPHVWYAWRHKSFGSSANNHLLGELAGLILATARWPELAKLGAPLGELQRQIEHEVLAQFAEDGGNKEQALNYQLFSWELCWQARAALLAAGHKITPEVDERLGRAAQFFVDVQVRGEPWDYGDSDSAFATPFFADDSRAIREWYDWLVQPESIGAIQFFLGEARTLCQWRIVESLDGCGDWWHAIDSGYAMRRGGDWTLRWDLSPLGYLKTAAHGHLDALHLSLWLEGVAMTVDPGTGCYYADEKLRQWLASRAAHNGPSPEKWFGPVRLGSFLWSQPHIGLQLQQERPGDWLAKWNLLSDRWAENALQTLYRRLETGGEPQSLSVFDGVEFRDRRGSAMPFTVRWQFPPGAKVELCDGRKFRVSRKGVAMDIELSEDWAEVYPVTERSQVAALATSDLEREFAGTVSPAFRKVEWAPFLKLVARPQAGRACVFRTTFLASPRS